VLFEINFAANKKGFLQRGFGATRGQRRTNRRMRMEESGKRLPMQLPRGCSQKASGEQRLSGTAPVPWRK